MFTQVQPQKQQHFESRAWKQNFAKVEKNEDTWNWKLISENSMWTVKNTETAENVC